MKYSGEIKYGRVRPLSNSAVGFSSKREAGLWFNLYKQHNQDHDKVFYRVRELMPKRTPNVREPKKVLCSCCCQSVTKYVLNATGKRRLQEFREKRKNKLT